MPAFPSSIVSRQIPRYSFQRRWLSDEVQSQSKPEEKDVNATADVENVKPVESEVESVETDFAKLENVAVEGAATHAAESAEAGLEYAGEVPERNVRTSRQKNKARTLPPPNETIYVGNIFFDVTAEDLRSQMEKYGIVEQARIVHDDRGLSKG